MSYLIPTESATATPRPPLYNYEIGFIRSQDACFQRRTVSAANETEAIKYLIRHNGAIRVLSVVENPL